MRRNLALLLLSICAAVAPRVGRADDLARWKAQAARVTIIRDTWGVPHIYGKTDADAVFGLMFAQAEDDFNRIEMNYINASGRLAEVEGEANRSVAQRNVAQVVPGLPKIDAVLGAGGNDSFGIVEGMLASGYTMATMPPICTGADGTYIQWWREARDKHGYEATGLNADPECGAWATYYLARILESDDNEPKEWYMPSVLVNNENLDSFKDTPVDNNPVQLLGYDDIPAKFTRTPKLP